MDLVAAVSRIAARWRRVKATISATIETDREEQHRRLDVVGVVDLQRLVRLGEEEVVRHRGDDRGERAAPRACRPRPASTTTSTNTSTTLAPARSSRNGTRTPGDEEGAEGGDGEPEAPGPRHRDVGLRRAMTPVYRRRVPELTIAALTASRFAVPRVKNASRPVLASIAGRAVRPDTWQIFWVVVVTVVGVLRACASPSSAGATASSGPTTSSTSTSSGDRGPRGRGDPVTGENIAGLVLAVLLAVYLVAALALPREVLMTFAGWAQLIALIVVLGVTAPLLGRYIANVYDGGPSRLDRVFGPVERLIYRACRIDPEREQRWNVYAFSLLAFSVVGLLPAVRDPAGAERACRSTRPTWRTSQPALSFNTAVSFVTNTNWQSYAGETTMSHLTQMVGLTVQQFVSAAVGMAVMAALIRGLSARRAAHDRQLLGRPRAHDLPHPPAARLRVRDRAARHRRHPEHARLHRRAHGRRRHAEDPRRAEREHGVDQAAGNERRRLLQRQLRAPVLEPDRASATSSSSTRS